MQNFTAFFIKFKTNLLTKRAFLLNVSSAMTVKKSHYRPGQAIVFHEAEVPKF